VSNLSDLLPAGASAKQITATDSGSGIASKAPVVMSASGTVSAISETASGNSAATASQYDAAVLFYYGSMVYDPDTQRVVLAYIDTNNSYYASIVVGEASASGVTWGTPVTVYSGQTVNFIAACYDTTNDRVGVAYNRYGGGAWYAGYSIDGGTNTPSSIATHVQFSTGNEYYIDLAYHPGENVIVSVSTTMAYSPNRGKVSVARLGASSITLGNEEFFDPYGATVYPQAQSAFNLVYESNLAELIVNFADASNSGYMTTCVISPAGTGSATFGAYNVYVSEQSYNNTLTFDENSGKLLYTYRRASTSPTFRGAAKVGLASGTSVTVDATENYFTSTGQAREQDAAYDATAKKIGLVYYVYSSGSETRFVDATTSASDYSVTFGTDVAAYTAVTSGAGAASLMAYDSALGKLVWAFNNSATSISQTNILTVANTTTNLTAQAFVGVADSAISASAAGSIIVQGGTVSEITDPFGTVSPTYGTPVSGGTSTGAEQYRMAYDSANNRVVAVYKDGSNSDYGTAVVGELSGTSITWGNTPVVFNNAATGSNGLDVAFDSNLNRIVIAYQNQGTTQGCAKVGTVSGSGTGSTITFGAEATFLAADTRYLRMAFDSNDNRMVIVFADITGSTGAYTYRTDYVIGTVSTGPDAISFNTPAAVNGSSGMYEPPGVCFDASENKILIAYANESYDLIVVNLAVSSGAGTPGTASTYGSGTPHQRYPFAVYDSGSSKCGVGFGEDTAFNGKFSVIDMSGANVTINTPVSLGVTFDGNAYSTDAAYDPDKSQIGVAFRQDTADGNKGGVVYGTISGTTSTWGSESLWESSVLAARGVAVVYDTTADKFVFIGSINSTGAASTVVGTLAADAFTAGTKYYVTTTGGFSSSAGDPSVNAGLAISTTSLLLNGDS